MGLGWVCWGFGVGVGVEVFGGGDGGDMGRIVVGGVDGWTCDWRELLFVGGAGYGRGVLRGWKPGRVFLPPFCPRWC